MGKLGFEHEDSSPNKCVPMQFEGGNSFESAFTVIYNTNGQLADLHPANQNSSAVPCLIVQYLARENRPLNLLLLPSIFTQNVCIKLTVV
jgi:hypothetical protein